MKTFAPPTKPGLYWVRMVDPKELGDYPLAHNERVVMVVRCKDGGLSVEAKDYRGYVGQTPAEFACHRWGPPVRPPRF